jgi:hypothetical protein
VKVVNVLVRLVYIDDFTPMIFYQYRKTVQKLTDIQNLLINCLVSINNV